MNMAKLTPRFMMKLDPAKAMCPQRYAIDLQGFLLEQLHRRHS
jgi:hypothetical protein